MRYNQIYLPLLAIILIPIFQSCKKDPVNEEEKAEYTFAFTRRALEYVKLTEGKYLIYKDSVSGQIDSVIITKSKLANLFHPKTDAMDLSDWGLGWASASPSCNYQEFTLELTKYDVATHYVWLYGWGQTASPNPIASTDTAALALQLSGGFPFPNGFYFAESSIADYSMDVEGVHYTQVLVISHEDGNDPSDPYYSRAIYYWAKGVGLIKYEYVYRGIPDKTYTLVRHN